MELLSHKLEKWWGGPGVQMTCQVGERAIRPPPRDAKDLDDEVLSSREGLGCR